MPARLDRRNCSSALNRARNTPKSHAVRTPLFISFVVNTSVVDVVFSNPLAVGVRAGRIPLFKDLSMNQRELNCEVARKTGETVSTIAALGFIPLTNQPFESEPLTIDWDERDADRNVALMPQRARSPVVF